MSSEYYVFTKSHSMVRCWKSYCKSCNFQSLQKASWYTRSVSNRTFLLYESLVPVFVSILQRLWSTRFSLYMYCGVVGQWVCDRSSHLLWNIDLISIFGVCSLSSLSYKQKNISLVFRTYEYPKRCTQIYFRTKNDIKKCAKMT